MSWIYPAISAILVVYWCLYRFIIYPAFVSSLAKVPSAHITASISPFWILYHRLRQTETFAVHDAHTRLGPIVRLAPNELSVNSVDGGIKTIYVGGFEKDHWYSNAFSNYGIFNMFSTETHAPHSKRKRMVSNIYAKSTLQSSQALHDITSSVVEDRMLTRLREASQSDKPIEFYHLFGAAAFDLVTAYIFGRKNGSDLVSSETQSADFVETFKSRQIYTFWIQEMPDFYSFMRSIGLGRLLIPAWVSTANEKFEDYILGCVKGAEKTFEAFNSADVSDRPLSQDYPTVYAQLRNAMTNVSHKASLEPEPQHPQHMIIASELLDHSLAGFDTSSITLTWLAWQLSRPSTQHWQQKLQAELAPHSHTLDPKTLDSLPILHAIIMESLRLHAAIPGNQPRITPSQPSTNTHALSLGDPTISNPIILSPIPPNLRVQAQAYSLHRNPIVFPDPETWNPARWLPVTHPEAISSPAQAKEMARWFWAFGSGGRMCVGSNLAMLDMKALVAGIWGRVETRIVDDEGMRKGMNGGYLGEPLGVGGKDGEGKRFLRMKVSMLDEE